MSLESHIKDRIDSIIAADKVVLFMKGNRNFPQCGFSATVVQILNGIVDEFATVNVLSDPAIRQGIKEYSSWPTIPQLYINGEFVGGCDIIKEMNQSGDLHKTLGLNAEAAEPPSISITPAAAAQLKTALAESDEGDCVRLSVSNRYEHAMELSAPGKLDVSVTSEGITVLFDPISAGRANGISIDFVDQGLGGAGFKIENPNAPATVEQIAPKDLASKLEAGEIGQLFDVRNEREREMANIGGTLLDDAAMAQIEQLPKDTHIAFYCHTGQRSNSAAEHFRDKGFTNLYNLAGGIDAWSVEVDPKIKRY